MMPKITNRWSVWGVAVAVAASVLMAGDPPAATPKAPVVRTANSNSASSGVARPSDNLRDKVSSATARAMPSVTSDSETFAEPYRTVQVATSEMGILRELLVQEGEFVEVGQLLAKLDDEYVRASLAIAERQRDSQGVLKSAEAELRLHASRAEKLSELLRTGHAHPEELERAVMEKEIAAARVLAAQESLSVRQLEVERIQVELARRSIRSPLQGVVTRTHREVGEFVSPTDPVVVTVVQLDPLLATFSLRPATAQSLKVGQPVQVQFASMPNPVDGEVEFLSQTTDARSGTMRVKVKIPNPQGLCRSGERCSLVLANPATALSDKLSSTESSTERSR
jgi:RND family efflux transporter MFP subunit